MRVFQGNLNRSRTAHHLLAQLCSEKKADIVLISEQYQDRAGVGRFADELGTATIWIPDPRLIHVSDQGTGNGYVWVRHNSTTYVSVYLTPNDRIDDIQIKLDDLEDALREMQGDLIVAGDLNAKALEWGPGYRETIPDVSLANEHLVAKVAGWQVIEDYTGSDHQYILFAVQNRRPAVPSVKRPPRWNIARMDRERLSSVIEEGWRSQQSTSASLSQTAQAKLIGAATMQLIQKACAIAVQKNGTKRQRCPVYCTTSEETRPRRCSFGRRLSSGQESAEEDHQGQSTTVLEGAVPGCRPESVGIRPKREISLDAPGISEVPQFTEEEQLRAASSTRNKKVPGPDGLPAEIIKVVAQSHPELLLNMYNTCLRGGIFPAPWKKAKLVLISKGKGT
ncbi:uncharacterized protein LOC118448520 [Vespa mandarinia]|uniref:uncharacterized protein LOC118448520 n=1 Tax=Vespa mandarinia TaxID=7446 RepID=UPI00160D1A60|nr:uncharacterized protein LOC118448520 [Vespa mandarinia]